MTLIFFLRPRLFGAVEIDMHDGFRKRKRKSLKTKQHEEEIIAALLKARLDELVIPEDVDKEEIAERIEEEIQALSDEVPASTPLPNAPTREDLEKLLALIREDIRQETERRIAKEKARIEAEAMALAEALIEEERIRAEKERFEKKKAIRIRLLMLAASIEDDYE